MRTASMEKSFTLSLLSFTLFVVNRMALASEWDVDSREELPRVMDGCETHFNMKLVSLDGEWESYMHYASEDGTAVLPDNNCEKVTWFQRATTSSAETTEQIQLPMTVSVNKAMLVGHQNGEYRDFYGVLTITMTQKPNNMPFPAYKKVVGENEKSNFLKHGTLSSPPPKMCVFYIGAMGPGEAVLDAHGFHNANCTLESPEVGPYNLISQ